MTHLFRSPHPRLPVLLTFGHLLLVSCFLPACYRAQNPSAMPPDFAVAVTVQVPEAMADTWIADPTAQPRPLRPARYILEPDDLLRVSVGPGANPATFPVFRRTLDDQQIESVWTCVRDSGWLEKHKGADPMAARAAFVDAANLPPVAEPTAMIYLCAGGHRTYFVAPLESSVDADPARKLIDTLAELAWIEK